MEYNEDYTGKKYADIAIAMGVKNVDKMSEKEYRNAAINAVKNLSKDVNIPTKCEQIKLEDLDALTKDALIDACSPGNPRDVTFDDIYSMFKKLI